MVRHADPFAIQTSLSRRLEDMLQYWRDLRRGEATVPFADDLDMTRIDEIAGDDLLLKVFQKPLRFRLDLAHTPRAPRVESELVNRFIDGVDLPPPLQFLQSQAAATVESAAPTVYEHCSKTSEPSYGRVLLPAWGEGHVSVLVCAFEFRAAD
jgi:hypothetical protein